MQRGYICGIMQPPSDTLLVRRRNPASPAPEPPARDAESEVRPQVERAILCAACQATITSTRHRVEVAGSHEHRFMNPAGVLFHIACFAEAIGCAIVGPDSLEYPWFAGFAWRYALCSSCGQHLGWHFRSEGKPSFFGLVLGLLLESSRDG